MAPTWCFLSASARLAMSSYSGTKKASVLPDPVHACTATSWWRSRRGIAAACTGVAVAKPIECSARSVGGFSGGCSDSNGQSLEAPPAAAAGAAVGVTCAVVLDAVAAVALLATRRSALSERPPSRWQLFGAVPQRPCASLPPPLSPTRVPKVRRPVSPRPMCASWPLIASSKRPVMKGATAPPIGIRIKCNAITML
eukprot:2120114-Pleurochrysis_carterae.AAC.1